LNYNQGVILIWVYYKINFLIKFNMKKRVFFILAFSLMLVFPQNIFAIGSCSPKGYTVLSINGIFTNEDSAKTNAYALKRKLGVDTLNSQPLSVDYLYNPTHLAGVGDFIDAIQQGVFNQKSDYDLTEMLNDASEKINTQKVLLVAHSQGNFYANNFYDKTASQPGGVPKESIGVYGVGSPANRVAGGGKYLTSDTDEVIAKEVASYIKILPPNIHIPILKAIDGNGHSFSNVYLKYQGDRMVKDIKSTLNKLKENDEQEINEPCISPQELTLGHKIKKVVLAVADPTANVVKGGIVGTYNAGAYVRDLAINTGKSIGNVLNKTGLAIGNVFKNLSANVVETLPDGGVLATGLASTIDIENDNSPIEEEKTEQIEEDIETQPLPENSNQEENINEIIVEEKIEEDIVKDKPRHSGGGGGSSSTIEQDPILDPISEPEPDPDPTPDPEPEPEPEPDPEIEPDPTPETDPEDELPPEEDPVELATFTIDENTTWSAGEYNYENLVITNNAVLTLEGDPESAENFKGVKINVVNLTIAEGASISADQKGYGPNQGPGAVQDTSPVSNPGAGYGGASSNDGVTYGSAIEPIDLGSGGAGLNHGGGAMHIVVSETFTNDGVVSSSGGESSSGGSIYVQASKIKGDGIFRANGGQLFQTGYFKSPGGGGRVALYYDDWSFDGVVEAKGGCGSYSYQTITCSQDGTAGVFDDTANDMYAKGSWKFLEDDGPFSFNNIFISDNAKVSSDKDISITAENISIDGNSSFVLADDQVLDVSNIEIDDGSTLTLSGSETLNTNTLIVSNNSIVTVAKEKILFLEISNIDIDSTSSILADAKGYGYNSGPGAPTIDRSGASHGGLGSGNTEASLYGSLTEPVLFGSGGSGYHPFGGGAIRIIVDDTFKNDGIVSANGNNTSSGGSIFVTAHTLEGTGKFTANGGESYCPNVCFGPGGGGRIAIYYKASSFSGQTTVNGWSGYGGASKEGTIHIVDESIVIEPEPEPDPEPEPEPDITLPSITSYIFNGVEDDVLVDSLADVTSLVFVANKNVDWVSIKIEKEDDESIFKSLRESSTCADGTNTCTKTWNALLAGDTTAPNGIYKVKVRIRDLSDPAIDYDYFSPYTITVEIPEDVPMEAMMEIIEEITEETDTEETPPYLSEEVIEGELIPETV